MYFLHPVPLSSKITTNLMLVEHCAQEGQATANTKHDHKGNNKVYDHVLLVRLAGPAVIFRAAGIALYKAEQPWAKYAAPPCKRNGFCIRASALWTRYSLGLCLHSILQIRCICFIAYFMGTMIFVHPTWVRAKRQATLQT
jgi:hypothetical protein